MLLNKISPLSQLTTVLKFSKFTFYGNRGKKLLEKYPLKYKQVTNIDSKNGFDLSSKQLQFPLNVPVKIKYIYSPKKILYIDNSKDIQWHQLQGNQVLLAFEQLSSLTSEEIVAGLQRLSIQPGQQEHVWNDHPWIRAAFEHIKNNPTLYKQSWTLKFYHLMKKLNNTDPEMWKFIYGRLEIEIFKMKNKDFIYFWEKYHNDKVCFSPEFVEGLFKLMEIRLRSFPPRHLIKAMQILEEHGRINYFYTHNVFLPLFKAPQNKFSAPEITEILKILMLYNIEKYDRFYDEFYPKLLTVRCETFDEARELRQTLIQMQDIFQSHIIAPYIQYFQSKEKDLKNKVKLITEKELYEIVQQDLHYFKEKLKMENQNK